MNNQNQEIQVPNFMKSENVKKQGQMLEEQRRQQYEIAMRMNSRKIKKKKAEMKRKLVSTAFIAGATLSIALLASNGYKQFCGGDIIANEFETYTTGYDIRPGRYAIFNGQEISVDSAVQDVINDARYGGMTEAEINVAVSRLYNSDLAKRYVGDVSTEDKINAKYQAYYESKLEKYTNVNGGMSK